MRPPAFQLHTSSYPSSGNKVPKCLATSHTRVGGGPRRGTVAASSGTAVGRSLLHLPDLGCQGSSVGGGTLEACQGGSNQADISQGALGHKQEASGISSRKAWA